MLRNNQLSTRSTPSWLVITVLVLSTITGAFAFQEWRHPAKTKDLVQWRDPVAGFHEAFEAKRPVYLYFTAAYKTFDSADYVTDFFSNPRLASCINENFVPVKVIDEHRYDTEKEAKIVEDLQHRFNDTHWFPRVLIVPFEYQGVKPQSFETQYYYGPDNTGRKWMYDYIFEHKDWHPLPHSPGAVHWTRLSEAERESQHTHKPIVYFFVRPFDEASEDMRDTICDDEETAEEINKSCVATLVVDYSLLGRKNDALADKLIQEYNVRCFPSFARKGVAQGKGESLIGYPGEDVTMEFIKAGLKENK